MKSDTSLVAIKGTKHGLTITLLDGPVPQTLHELSERLTRTASFFKGAQVTLNLENAAIGAPQLHEIDDLLKQHQITLRRIATQNTELAAAGASLGLQISPSESAEPHTSTTGKTRQPTARAAPPAPTDVEREIGESGTTYPAIVVRRTVRSGTAIRHEGHIIVVGDVNPGAELIAGGDVIVWGKLRGLVHAGALGDNNAIVCALHFEPTQLRIGNIIARMPEGKKRKSMPEMASVRNGKIEVVEWR